MAVINEDGYPVQAIARRVGRRWTLEIRGPSWFVNELETELMESAGMSLAHSDVYKIVLEQRLPLLEA